jgi:hypothetical protein
MILALDTDAAVSFRSFLDLTTKVRDLLDLVHNVILIECIFRSGNPGGVGILGEGE